METSQHPKQQVSNNTCMRKLKYDFTFHLRNVQTACHSVFNPLKCLSVIFNYFNTRLLFFIDNGYT